VFSSEGVVNFPHAKSRAFSIRNISGDGYLRYRLPSHRVLCSGWLRRDSLRKANTEEQEAFAMQ
jgi:hypothetical protein